MMDDLAIFMAHNKSTQERYYDLSEKERKVSLVVAAIQSVMVSHSLLSVNFGYMCDKKVRSQVNLIIALSCLGAVTIWRLANLDIPLTPSNA